MKQTKVVISLIMALMMIASTFVVAGNMNATCDPGLTVEKTVWDGEEWVDSITADYGDDVRFNITITYHKTADPRGYKAINLVVNDTLPPCLEYNDSAVIKHGDLTYYGEGLVDGKTIWWYLYADYGIELHDDDDPARTVTIEFNATVVDYGVNVNHVNVTGMEKCSNEPLFGDDTATVDVPTPEHPDIDIVKMVWDEEAGDWSDDGPVTVYEGDSVTFYVNVTNTGNVALHNVIVTDVVPDFLSSTGAPNLNIGTLGADEYYYNEFTLTVQDIDEVKIGENYANVTADEDVFDEDDAQVIAKPHFILEKQVWNGTAWTEYLDHVRKGEPVKFRITATYYGDDLMKCLVIGDFLPEICLEYADNEKIWIAGQQITSSSSMWPDIYVGEGETIVICDEIEEELPEGVIVWDWRNAVFGLNDGESVIIEFETTVTEYCDECLPCGPCINPNCAIGLIWGCMQCTPCSGYKDLDCAFVRCCPPPTTFTKKVLDGQKWVDEIETVVGNTLTFKLEFEYYGDENLTEIQFVDELPCILDYANNVDIYVIGGDAALDTVELSNNGKTIWFNFTGNLSDGGKITITFDVEVTGSTGTDCCGDCECVNYAEVNGEIGCPPEYLHMEDIVDITALSNCPPSIPQLTGDTEGEEDETLTFEAYTTDSDGDKVFYKFDYDGYTTGWLGPYTEGVEKTFTYSWDTAGTYDVRVRAKDIHGATSEWSYALEVTITEEEPEPPEEGLDISIPMINIGGVSAILENTGELDINDITWNITVGKQGLIGSKVFAENNGTIDTLEGGNTTTVTSGKTGLLRFALLGGYVRVAADSPDLDEPVEVTKKAIILGPIVIVI